MTDALIKVIRNWSKYLRGFLVFFPRYFQWSKCVGFWGFIKIIEECRVLAKALALVTMLQICSPAHSIAAGSLFEVDVSSCSQVPYLRVSARLPVKLWCIQKRQQVDWTRSPASEILPIAEVPRVILAACATGYSSVQRQAAHALR